MSQKAKLLLEEDLGHEVRIEYAIDSQQMILAGELHQPDLIVCPFLTKRIPDELFNKFKCLIVHPGIKGDRGPSSLDWCIMNKEKEWGVTIVEAHEEMDHGDIWASTTFPVKRQASKASLYRKEVLAAAMDALRHAVTKFQTQSAPEPLDYSKEDVKGILRPSMKQTERKIDWDLHVDDIIHVLNAADTRPGVAETIHGEKVYLFGAKPEYILAKGKKFKPKTIIAQRDEYVCIACGHETAVWIQAMKKSQPDAFKLPATMVLPASTLREVPTLDATVPTSWREIWTIEENGACYLYFDFYNGAMSTANCLRLLKVLKEISTRESTKVVVLMGGYDFFSNGIHLNVIEASQDPALESWNNINAINDVVLQIMTMKKMVISAIRGNAAAGGLMMALAADSVWTHDGVVLNPHYKTMKLYGSEYWTYNLPRRVGEEKAHELTESMRAISVSNARRIQLVDEVLPGNTEEFEHEVKALAQRIASGHGISKMLGAKKNQVEDEQWLAILKKHREQELSNMAQNFTDPAYHKARSCFVRKLNPTTTPPHLTTSSHQQKLYSKVIQHERSPALPKLPFHPSLVLIQVGNNDGVTQHAKSINNGIGQVIYFSASTNTSLLENQIVHKIELLSRDPLVSGIVLQLPLPPALSFNRIVAAIAPEKDVDGVRTLLSSTVPTSSILFSTRTTVNL